MADELIEELVLDVTDETELDGRGLVTADEVVVEAEDWLLIIGAVVDVGMPGATEVLEMDGTDEFIFESSYAQKCSS